MKRLEYLSRHGSIAFVALSKARWPFRYFYRVVDDKDLPPAWVSGIFRVTLTMNRHYLGESASTCYRTFVVDHEIYHMKAHHNLWSLLALVFFAPLWPLARMWQEFRADQYAARSLTDVQVLHICERLDSPGRWHRLLYGKPLRRAARAKEMFLL